MPEILQVKMSDQMSEVMSIKLSDELVDASSYVSNRFKQDVMIYSGWMTG